MNELNIPIYRAKKIDSDKWVVGYYNNGLYSKHYLNVRGEFIEIDVTTLAISFENMKDSEDNPIFASLSEDGKGGDRCKKEGIGYINNISEEFTTIFINGNTYAKYSENDKELLHNLTESIGRVNLTITIIEIQK